MPIRCLTVIFYLLCASALVYGQAASEKLPAPKADEVTTAKKLIADVYKKDYDGAKSPAEQKKLASKLLKDGAQSTPGSAEQFALFEVAKNICIKIGDIDGALAAAQQTAGTFQIDWSTIQKQVLNEIAPLAKLPAERQLLVRYLNIAYTESLQADKLRDAADLLELAESTAKKSSNLAAVKRWTRRKETLRQRTAAREQMQQALALLEQKPVDPEANQTCGEYLCFYLDDWNRGLPMLALGPPSALKKIAEREIQGAKSPADRLALADAWYDEAHLRDGAAKVAILELSESHYRAALEGQTGLAKRKVENRLEELERNGEPIAICEWVELVDLARLGKDTKPGIWRREMGALRTDYDDGARVVFPVIADGSFELEVVSTRHRGPDQYAVGLSLAANGSGFIYDCLAGQESSLGEKRIAPANLLNGKPHQLSLVLDRKDGNCACVVRLDDKPYFQWSGPADSLKPVAANRSCLAIQTWKTDLVLHSVRFRLKNGNAWLVD
ncbi:hypothetical protein NA78x_001892 [Anatilimnocola sp. NA78]|uniref:hypothetical protein n=1 Tax=Anatilimnocola sp. NA78 TaxID=3415683 RepID=UPI003CE5A65D